MRDSRERPLSIALVIPHGEPREGFFGDTLLSLLCADARALGHRAEIVRVYYDGRDAAREAQVRERLARWIAERDADIVVVERLFDPAPLTGSRALLQVTLGDSLEPLDGVTHVLGATPGTNRRGTRRSPRLAELREGFAAYLEAARGAREWADVPGLARITAGHLEPLAPAPRESPRRPFAPVLEHDVIALEAPPPIVRKALYGNVGCPFGDDPLEAPHYRGVSLPIEPAVARLGCAFCHMGGDYERRPDDEVVADLVEQAEYFTRGLPALEELVLTDQHPARYLEALLRAAHARGVRPLRWLFAARADSFVRERERIERAARAARETGHVLEVYLSGFESFSDAELARYNKGVRASELVAAVEAMREIARAHRGHFELDRARGHSLLLFGPWTTPEDLLASADAIRAHGLRQLFDELGRNRLRLHRDLPVYYAAERDGLVLDAWREGDEGAARRKGYSAEIPWRFADARTARAHELATQLRDALGHETELAQLRAAALHGAPAEDGTRVAGGVARLGALLDALARDKGADGARVSQVSARPIWLSGPCNNGCAGCANRERWAPPDLEALAIEIAAARSGGAAICIAGREPTLHPELFALLSLARGDDERMAGIVSNGRRFSHAAYARGAVRAGLRAASVKVFGPSAPSADAYTRDEGGFTQACAGIAELARAGVGALELRVSVGASPLADLAEHAALADRLGVRQLRLEVALDVLGLASLDVACDAIDALRSRARALGVAVTAATLRAGPRDFFKLPGARCRCRRSTSS